VKESKSVSSNVGLNNLALPSEPRRYLRKIAGITDTHDAYILYELPDESIMESHNSLQS
jgi:hypothetical protein